MRVQSQRAPGYPASRPRGRPDPVRRHDRSPQVQGRLFRLPPRLPKAAINDVGLVDAVHPVWKREKCLICGFCAGACREGAIVPGDDERPVFLTETCLYCGDCVKLCPSEAWQDQARRCRVGSLLDRLRTKFPNSVKRETAPPIVIDRHLRGESTN